MGVEYLPSLLEGELIALFHHLIAVMCLWKAGAFSHELQFSMGPFWVVFAQLNCTNKLGRAKIEYVICYIVTKPGISRMGELPRKIRKIDGNLRENVENETNAHLGMSGWLGHWCKANGENGD